MGGQVADSEGINPQLMSRFMALQAAARAAGHNVGIGSGYRTVDEQIALRKSNGCPDIWSSPASSCRVPTAIPGHSNHNHGLAIDFSGDDAADAWVAANMGQFGLHLPVEGENWHLEMVDDEGSHTNFDPNDPSSATYNLNWMEEQANPEDELASRLHDMMGAFTSGTVDAETPEAMMQLPGQDAQQVEPLSVLGTDETTIPGGQPSFGPMSLEGGQWKGGLPPPGYIPPGEGTDRWRDVALAALQYTGEDPKYLDLMMKRMAQESSGNPFAVNDWDSNAMNGDPTKGLMQNLGSAFAGRAGELADRGIFDGFANMVASIRYTKKQYGNLMAWGRPGGY